MANVMGVYGRIVYDSRGNQTVECDLRLDDGSFGRASVPSGASTGIHEAAAIEPKIAVNNINTEIVNRLIREQADQAAIDKLMIDLDGTENKSRLGANAILAVSLALSKAAAESQKTTLWKYFKSLSRTSPEKNLLPVPLMNILNGGRHADKSSDFQEYMIVPVGAASFGQAMEIGTKVFARLKAILKERGFATTVGDEGGFAPSLGSNEEPLQMIMRAIEKAGYRPGEEVALAIDVAASEFLAEGKYHLKSEARILNREEMIGLLEEYVNKYPIISIEDGLEQDDWDGWSKLTEKLGGRVQLVGDDLFVTNTKRLEQGIANKAANSILIKLNQIGTVSETIAAIDLARSQGYTAIVSHRSGETEDTTIADLVAGTGTGQIKTGSLSRSERIAKYNQLLRIEEEMKDEAKYAGRSAFLTGKNI